jgi:hypothetical protein
MVWRWCILVALVAGCASRGESTAERRAGQSPVEREFAARVGEYVALHRRVAREQPAAKQTDDAAAIKQRQQALAAAIRQARPQPDAGAIFTPPVAAELRGVIEADLKETGTAAVADTAPEEKPDARLGVYAAYPDDQPLASVPPVLLSRLPPLPEELEYRFIGRRLVLVDREANMVVDYLPAAVPAQPRAQP